MVEWFWWDLSLIFDDQLASFVALYGLVWPVKSSKNDLLCVEWDVKPYTLTLAQIDILVNSRQRTKTRSP